MTVSNTASLMHICREVHPASRLAKVAHFIYFELMTLTEGDLN